LFRGDRRAGNGVVGPRRLLPHGLAIRQGPNDLYGAVLSADCCCADRAVILCLHDAIRRSLPDLRSRLPDLRSRLPDLRSRLPDLCADNDLPHFLPARTHRGLHAGHVDRRLFRLRGNDVPADARLDLLWFTRAQLR
jgi:hypothetical protein